MIFIWIVLLFLLLSFLGFVLVYSFWITLDNFFRTGSTQKK